MSNLIYLCTDSSMTCRVWHRLDAVPEVKVCRLGHAVIDDTLRRVQAHEIVELALDTVVGYFVTWAKRVGVVREWAIGNTQRWSSTVTTKPKVRDEQRGLHKRAGIDLLGPIPRLYVNSSAWSAHLDVHEMLTYG
jgi:hypothetical protein